MDRELALPGPIEQEGEHANALGVVERGHVLIDDRLPTRDLALIARRAKHIAIQRSIVNEFEWDLDVDPDVRARDEQTHQILHDRSV